MLLDTIVGKAALPAGTFVTSSSDGTIRFWGAPAGGAKGAAELLTLYCGGDEGFLAMKAPDPEGADPNSAGGGTAAFENKGADVESWVEGSSMIAVKIALSVLRFCARSPVFSVQARINYGDHVLA